VVILSLFAANIARGQEDTAVDASKAINPGGFMITESRRAYYLTQTCNPDAAVCSCREYANVPQSRREQTIKLEDYVVYKDDVMDLPIRVYMPWPDSYFEMRMNKHRYIFDGAMIVCMDYNPLTRKVMAKVFQAGDIKFNIAYQNGETLIRTLSDNPGGVKHTLVNVSEGVVSVDSSWLCGSCLITRPTVVHANECYVFDPAGLCGIMAEQEAAAPEVLTPIPNDLTVMDPFI